VLGKKFWAHAAILGANIIYGLNYSIAKDVMPEFIQPFGFIFCRVSGALLLFWMFSQFAVKEKVAQKDLALLAVCGGFGVAANQLMFFYGLNLTSPINAAIILTCNPILVLIISAVVIKERITSRKIIGIGLGLTGAAGLILFNGAASLSSDGFIGDLFVFLNATSYAIYLVLVKPLMNKYKPMTVIKWVFFFGFIYVLPFGWNQFHEIDWSGFTPNIWGAFVFVVVGTTFLAYLFNIFGLRELSPSVVSIYIYSQPLIASIMAIALQKDELSYEKIIAALFIFSGVYLVSTKKSAKKIA
jgi:drug/metabolite transporter (DMT)-like permease